MTEEEFYNWLINEMHCIDNQDKETDFQEAYITGQVDAFQQVIDKVNLYFSDKWGLL